MSVDEIKIYEMPGGILHGTKYLGRNHYITATVHKSFNLVDAFNAARVPFPLDFIDFILGGVVRNKRFERYKKDAHEKDMKYLLFQLAHYVKVST